MGVRMGPSGQGHAFEAHQAAPTRPWLNRIDLAILPVAFLLDILLFSSLLRTDVMTTAGRLAILCYSAAGVALLVFRRLAPVAVFGVIWLHSVLALVVTDVYVPVVFLLVALEAVAELRPLRVSLAALAVVLAPTALLVVAAVRAASEPAAVTAGLGSVAFYLALDSLAWGIGRWVRRQHRQVETGQVETGQVETGQVETGQVETGQLDAVQVATVQVERSHEVQEQRAETERAISAERLRIARELHDIVAHCVTTMVLHASSARRVVDTDPNRAKQSLTAIEESGQQALGELRRLLELLRENGAVDAGSGAPLPGLAQLGPTINSVRGSGVVVTLEVSGTPRRLDASTDLAAYRLVQEALTNVSRHSGTGANATVSIEWGAERVTLAVEDDGQGVGESISASMSMPISRSLSARNGLAGLRERISIAGGEFVAGPTEAGGFRVAARLPLSEFAGGAAHTAIPVQPSGGTPGAAQIEADRFGRPIRAAGIDS